MLPIPIRKVIRFSLLTLTVILVCIAVPNFSVGKLEAKEVPPSSEAIATNWQNAVFPVENFQQYTSLYGYRVSPTSGQVEFHNGIDIAAPLGSYVHNWWAGKVIELSDHTACGTMVRIESGEWQHIYCHLSGHVEGDYLIDRDGGILIQKGQIVAAGTRIGRIGMTGRTTGPHLHWGLKYNQEYIDPAVVLTAMYKPS